MIFLDTESCGLTGPCILIQYAEGDGLVKLHHVFRKPIRETLELIEYFCEHTGGICGFNLVHDWFQLTKLYNILRTSERYENAPTPELFAGRNSEDPYRDARRYTIKPVKALDLFLHARKGPYQSLMERDDIKIKNVPIKMGTILCDILKDKFKLPLIYFKNAADPETAAQWKVDSIDGNPDFVNVVLRFKPSMGLKALASEIFKTKQLDYPIPKEFYPVENDYNPYTIEWKLIINEHIKFWWENKTALSYAEQDVVLLQRLWHTWGEPAAGDIDSKLACHVGGVRWHGFSIDKKIVIDKSIANYEYLKNIKINFDSHHAVKRWLLSVATEKEKILIRDTSKHTLEILSELNSEVSNRAKEIIHARKISKENDYLNKLLETSRFCPNFKIIGAKSGRMSGGFSDIQESNRSRGSLNPQGIKRDKDFRRIFMLSEDNESLSGGDFDAFEVTLADAVYQDKKLREDLQQGKSVHGVLGSMIYEEDYDTIMASKGLSESENMYNPAKNSFFGLLYGAQEHKISETAKVDINQAKTAYKEFLERYPRVGTSRKLIFDAFCSMSQPNGLGTAVVWKEPAPFIETLLGFRRYFTLENQIVKVLFELAQNPPRQLENIGQCIRPKSERIQTYRGATMSSLYSCAFQIQARNMRAAANHVIQGTGAQINKELQGNIVDLSPSGISTELIKTLNIHDEVLVTHQSQYTNRIKEVVNRTIINFSKLVPLLKINWKTDMKSWAEK